jgi:hypothetical protein
MRTIYVVTRGEYSEYCIMALFSTKELAEMYVQRMGTSSYYDNCIIEEYELDSINADWLAGKVSRWHVAFHPNSADIRTVEKIDYGKTDELVKEWDWGLLSVYMLARDEQHAAKIAMEKRSVYLANKGTP